MEKIVVLHTDVAPDASEDELDCLKQAETVSEALLKIGFEPVLMPFSLDLSKMMEALRQTSPRAVFNLVETVAGKGSLIYLAPALLDLLNIPYTGCRTDAMYLTSNKPLAKKIIHESGINTPAWFDEKGNSFGSMTSDTMIVKACWEDASVGLDDNSVMKFTDTADTLNAIGHARQKLGVSCFAEAYIEGREFNIALLAGESDVRILPPAEILFQDYPKDKLKMLDYRSKWIEDSFEYEHTCRTLDIAPKDTALIDDLRDIALRCWKIFDLRGYARVDFRVDQNGVPWLLEINANPCLSPDAGFAAALEHADIPYHEAIGLLINDAINNPHSKPRRINNRPA